MKRFLFLGLIFAMLIKSHSAQAFSPEQQFERGNHYYNQAEYDSAIYFYQSVINVGYASQALYYNLANAYFKTKEIPSAILYYEKALKIDPSDEDIKHNLTVCNAMIVDKIEVIPQLFFKEWWDTFYSMLPADDWAWISVIIFILTLLAAYFYLTSFQTNARKTFFFIGLFLLFLSLASFGLASQKYYYTQQTNEAIVFEPTITVKSSPAATSVDLFVLHEGTKVSLLDKTNGWKKIKISNGSVGWLPDNALKGI